MRILIATDGSESAVATEDFLTGVTKSDKMAADIVSAVPHPQYTAFGFEGNPIPAEVYDKLVNSTRKQLERATEKFRAAHWDTTSHLCDGAPATKILEMAKTVNPDLVAIGAHGASPAEKFLMGSVSSKVVRHAECSVLIHRGPAEVPGERLRVMLAHDGSEFADQAVTFLKNYPWSVPLEVLVVRVIELVEVFNMDAVLHTSGSWAAGVKQVQQSVAKVAAELTSDGIQADGAIHQDQNVAEELLRVSHEWKPDLMVIGHQGRGAVAQFLLGSVAYRIAEHAPSSVLVVR